MELSKRLEELNIELPTIAAPVAAYIPAMVVGDTVRTSGQLPLKDGILVSEGLCGTVAVTEERAKEAAKQCALNALAAAADTAGGLDRIDSVIKVTGFVASTPEFHAQPSVINGASELFQQIFGSAHIRSAIGAAALPLDATVEVEVEFALK